MVYQDAEYIFRQAKQRNRGNRQAVGMGDAVVCRGKCYWEGLWTRTSFGRWHCSQERILTAMVAQALHGGLLAGRDSDNDKGLRRVG